MGTQTNDGGRHDRAAPAVGAALSCLRPGVMRVEDCRLSVVPDRWRYADDNHDAIDRLWEQRRVERPQLFNGRIFLMSAATLAAGQLTASFIETEFKAYLHWREAGFPEAGVRDAFGSALIRTAEGYLLYGRQRPGHVNGGLVCPPGGFIDPRDAGPDGDIDIAASIAREVAEETGLVASELSVQPGYWLAITGPHVSMAREFRADRPALDLVAQIARTLAADPDPELAEMVAIRSAADVEPTAPSHGRLLAAALLGG